MTMYESVAKRAARTGEQPHLIRRDAAAGRIPGAVRVGGHRSPWALPIDTQNADTPAHSPGGVAGVSRTQHVRGTLYADVMSTSAPDTIAVARRVADRAQLVHTRPARALTDLVYAVAAVAASHTVTRDGMCAACGWTYPCPTRRDLDAALAHADTLTRDGAA